MATHEQQDQRVISLRGWPFGGLPPLVGQDPLGDDGFTALTRLLAAYQVCQPAGGDCDQPGAGTVGYAVLRPLQGRRNQGLLCRVLGGGEKTRPPDHPAEDLWRQTSQQVLDL